MADPESPEVIPRFLALGDSYTIGQSVEPSERWPVQLARRLQEAQVQIVEPENIARTGWTTSELSKAIEAADLLGPYELVILMIGVNDQFRGLGIDDYRLEFAALLRKAVKFARDRPSNVVVVSTPDWGVTPFARGLDRQQIAGEIDEFNMVAQEETASVGARFVDVTGISREAGQRPSLIALDGLHPSGEMYSAWVDLILPEALDIVQRPAPK